MEPEDEPEMKKDSFRPDEIRLSTEEKPLIKNQSFINVEVSIPHFEHPGGVNPSYPKEEEKLLKSPSPPFPKTKEQNFPELPPWMEESMSPIPKTNEHVNKKPSWVPSESQKSNSSSPNHEKNPLKEAPPWVVSQSQSRKSPAKRTSYSIVQKDPPSKPLDVSSSPSQKKNSLNMSSSPLNENKSIEKIPNLPSWVPKPESESLSKKNNSTEKKSENQEIPSKNFQSPRNSSPILTFPGKNPSKPTPSPTRFNPQDDRPPWFLENQPEPVVSIKKDQEKFTSDKKDYTNEDLPPWVSSNVSQPEASRKKNIRTKKITKEIDRPPWVSNKEKPNGEVSALQKNPGFQLENENFPKIPKFTTADSNNENFYQVVEKNLEILPKSEVLGKIEKINELPPWFSQQDEEIPPRREEEKKEMGDKNSKFSIKVEKPVEKEKHVKFDDKSKIEQGPNELPPWFSQPEDVLTETEKAQPSDPGPLKPSSGPKGIIKKSEDLPPWFDNEESSIKEVEKPLKPISAFSLPSSSKVEEKSSEKPAEVKPPETKPPEKKPSETKPPETKPPQTKPPEKKPPKLFIKREEPENLPPWMQPGEETKEKLIPSPKLQNAPSHPSLPPWMVDDDPPQKSQSTKDLLQSPVKNDQTLEKNLKKDPIKPSDSLKLKKNPESNSNESLPPWLETKSNSKLPNLKDQKPPPLIPKTNENIPVWFTKDDSNDPPFLEAEQGLSKDIGSVLPPWITSPNNQNSSNLFFPSKPATRPASAKPEGTNQNHPAQPVKLETTEKIFIMGKKKSRGHFEKRPSLLIQKESSKSGFIQYGDILCLSSKETISFDDKTIIYRGVITGDGISYNDLGCISKTIVKEQSFNIQFRQSLFRVEPARQYGFLNVYNKYIKKPNYEEKYAKILKEQADEEEQGNEAEIELTTGQILTYGERIQLRHIHSNCFITISRDIAIEHGALKVKLDYKGSENSWLEILPSNKIRQEGEPVRYIDGFLITSKVEKSSYFIHLGKSTVKAEEKVGEVNASEEVSVWRAKKYITVHEQRLNPGSISTGDSFRILHKDSERYLSAAAINIQTLLPPIEKEKEAEDDELTSCVVAGPSVGKGKEVDAKYTELVLDKNNTSRGLWELERINPFQGGPSHLEEEYRLKNIATGMYLHIERTTKLSKNSTEIQLVNSFKFEQEESRSLLLFNTNLQIRYPAKSIFLGIVEKEDSIEKYFKGTKIEKHSEFYMQTFESDKKAEIQTTFIFEDESEKNSSHVYQISTILMSLVEIYKQINVWGFLRQGSNYYSSYKMAVDTEIELMEIVNRGTELLDNLKNKILNPSNFYLIQNQMTIKDSGLLELLLKLLQLIDIRLTISASKQSQSSTIEKEKFNMSKLFQSKTREIILCPQAVSRKHLRRLASSIYRILVLCIKDNVSCCEFVKSHNEFLGLQLMQYKTEVGTLLREIFKHSTSTISESSLNEFQMWVSQLRSLNESMENVSDQILILKIISSLCTFKEQGMKKYQVYVNKFIFKRLSMFVHLRETSDDLEFKFLPINESEEEFIRNNPSIAEFSDGGVTSPYISIANLSDGLVRYLCAVINLLATASLSENNSVIERLRDYNKISPQGLLISIKNHSNKVKIKTRFLYLLRVLYLYETHKISPKEFKIIEWDNETNKIIKSRVFSPEWVTDLIEWVRMVWTSQEPQFGVLSSTKEGVSFVIELVNITKVLIHNNFTTYEFIEDICPFLALVLSDNSNTDIVRLCRSGHWCCCMREKASTHPELLQTLVFKVMRLFEDISEVKLQRQIEFLIENHTVELKKEVIERFSINFKVQNNQYFNMYLLNVMLSKFEKYIRDYASEQLVQIFNQRNFIKTETDELILLYEPGMVEVKQKCYSCVSNLKKHIESLNLQVSYLKDNKSLEDNKKLQSVLKETLKTLNELQTMMNIKGDSDLLKLGQNIFRCLQLDEILIKFLEQPYPWLVQVSPYRKKVRKSQLTLYRAIASTLSAYTFHNSKNQEVVYSSIALIISYFGNKMGVSRLISHIASSQRTASKVDHVIIYIFHLITQEKDNPHHPYLKILKNLVIDENYQMFLWTQTNIVKFILKNESIVSYYCSNGTWNIIEYKDFPGIEFHKTFISLLSLCAVQNEFVTLQCRNLVAFPVLEREICNNQTPYSLKITYLMFALNVYFSHVSEELGAEFSFDYLSEILKNVVLKDLQLYTYYLADFLSIVQKFKFPGIIKRKDILALRPSISEDHDINDQELTPDEIEALNYWKYLLDTKLWKNEQSSGLLIFIKDLSIELKLCRFEPNDDYKVTIFKISEIIQRIHAKIEGISAQNPRMNFDSYIEGVSLCWCEIPKYSFENEEENIEELVKAQCYSNLIDTIKDYLIDQKMTIQDFFIYKLKVNSEIIPSKSLAYKLKNELKSLEFATITTGLSKMTAKSNQVMINIKDLKSAIIANSGLDDQKFDRNPTMAENIHQILSQKMDSYNKREVELNLFIQSIQQAIVEKLLLSFEYPKVLDFCKTLFSALYRKKYRKYLFEIFTQFLKVETEANRPKDQKIRRVELMNKALRQAGIGEIALNMICEGRDLESVIAAIEFLQVIFFYKNSKFSLHILSFFSDPLICFNFFSFFKKCIKDFQDEALNRSQGMIVKRFKSFIDNRKAHEVEMRVNLCLQALKLIEKMCEQNPEEFQDLFRNQTIINEFVVNVNIVSELTSLLISFSTFENNSCLKQVTDPQFQQIRSVCIQCLKTLTSLCEGPCKQNQVEVGLNFKVYSFVNWMMVGFKDVISEQGKDYIEILKGSIEFLSSLIEAELEPFIIKEILVQVDVENLLKICYFIHEKYVSGKETIVYRGDRDYTITILEPFRSSVPKLDPYVNRIIGVGFSIFNLCLSLKESFPLSEKLSQIKYTPKSNSKISKSSVAVLDENLKTESATNFYLENISKIEVNYKGSILQIYFQRPFLTRFLSGKSRSTLLKNIGNFTYQARIEEFFKRCIKYKFEMIYQQRLERYPLVASFCSYWYYYKTICFYLTCLINLILLGTLVRSNDSISISASEGVSRVLSILMALQIFFAILSLAAYLFEYSPILYRVTTSKSIKKTESRINGTVLVTELKKVNIDKNEKNLWQRLFQVISDFDVIYSFIYMWLSFLAIQNYLWYGVLILDCIKRSQVLKNVLRSITLNYKQLLLTLILGIIITFIFSIFGFLFYRSDYGSGQGMYSSSLSDCFFSTLNHGVRAQGGIGDVLIQSDPWYDRMLFDMAFFIIIIVVLLKVIFGIIIDTFAELRDMREQQIKNLEQTCFVCGKSKFDFELRRLSWAKHINEEHNAHAYAAFFIYIMLKKEDLSGIEKYLKNQVDTKEITFFPKTSIRLAKFETAKAEIKENYSEKFKDIRNRLVKLADYNV